MVTHVAAKLIVVLEFAGCILPCDGVSDTVVLAWVDSSMVVLVLCGNMS